MHYNSGNKPNIAESAGRGSGWQPAGSSENRSQQGGGTPRWPRSTAAARRFWPASAAVMVRPSSSLSFTMGRSGRCRSIRPRAAQSLAAITPTTSTVTVLRVRSRWTLWRWHPGTRMASSGSSPVASTSWTSLIWPKRSRSRGRAPTRPASSGASRRASGQRAAMWAASMPTRPAMCCGARDCPAQQPLRWAWP